MNFYVELFKHGEKISQIKFEKKIIRVGRGADCDVLIDDALLSRDHVLISCKDGVWYIDDVSRNGVRLQTAEPMQPRAKLLFDHLYQLTPQFSLRFRTDVAASAKEKTVIVSNRPTQVVSMNPETEKLVFSKASITYRNPEGRTKTYNIEDSLSIGSHAANGLHLDLSSVSAFHARIDLVQNRYVLYDLQSTNGVEVNGLKVLKLDLTDNCTFMIGSAELKFEFEKTEVEIKPRTSHEFLGMVSQNKAMKKVFSILEAVACTDASVFIQGETGTGKELVAKALHELSKRYDGQLVAVNCAALPKDLVESELFGHEKGAFTGADRTRLGAFELAHMGTLFLDEVAELDLAVQSKLLRALETGEIRKVGAQTTQKVSVRVVAATHKDLMAEVKAGRFREDLYYRLHVVPVKLPPLRDRPEDLEILIPYLLNQLHLPYEIDTEVLRSLQFYSFPGNVRELKNILQRAHIEFELANSDVTKKPTKILAPRHFSFLKDCDWIYHPKNEEEENEKRALQEALEQANFKQKDASKLLGIANSTFHDRLKKYGLTAIRAKHSQNIGQNLGQNLPTL